MKIQCDVCSRKEASVFCSADEAALCDICDQTVHHANKLASKHERFSLLYPSPCLAPLCDICQEKRAYVFCQQDRAILCRDCEVPLHTANEHTQKHNRFLLTGIKLSAISTDNGNNNPSIKNGGDPVPDFKPAKKPTSVSSEISHVSSNINGESTPAVSSGNSQQLGCGGSTSSISEYLIEMLPGWHFEDFFPDSVCKNGNKNDMEGGEDMMSFWDVDFDKQLTSSSQSENLGIRVPQPPAKTTVSFGQAANLQSENGLLLVNQIQGAKQHETSVNAGTKVGRKWRKDDGFTVPQIIQSVGSNNNKRPRIFW
ncbi:hypothetical protein Cgig2_026535 [Carnegiea gigantea]|uniref:B box-type domain-containing protein n=1 Tax=Carnegiea gigantea TaxID=171969 RepID=A0A9Q1KGU2_9CARY|nr:hypothetical protein Cgig2_026535 [Carnegiea gigantea]